MHMRRKGYVLALAFILLAIGAFSQAGIVEAEKRRAEAILQQGTLSGASANFRVRHYRFEWEVDPGVRYLRGIVTATIVLKSQASTVTFDFTDVLTVDSVLYHGQKAVITRPGNQTLQINFPASLPADAVDSLQIFYQGVPAAAGFGTFSISSHQGVPVMWTLSEPYGSKDWWPCRNGLEDKADSMDAIITTPQPYFASSNGLLQNESVANGKRTVWWKHRHPIASYLVAIAATNYEIRKDTIQLADRTLTLEHYTYPEWRPVWESSINDTRYIMRLFTQWVGPYPFSNEKYAHTQVSFGGGMEHQTNSFMGSADKELIAHELAHQWFGDKITCGSWQDIWLNEGFATFFTREYVSTIESPAQLLTRYREDIDRLITQPNGSVFVKDTSNPNRIFDYRLSYLKGMWVLRMLQWKLGNEVFIRGVKQYADDPRLRYGYARTADLKQHMEQVSGQTLTEFFADWVYGEGYPKYDLKWMPLGTNRVQLTLSQTTSDPSVNFFEMPVPIRFRNGNKDTMIVINHQRNGQTQTMDLGFVADQAVIDPELRIISANNVVQRTDLAFGANTMKVYPNPVGARFTILLANYTDRSAQVTIHNALGQQLYARDVQMPSGNELLAIPSDAWASGVYFVRVKTAGTNMVQRIVK